MFAGECGIAGEESEVGMGKGGRADLLDEGDLIAHGFQLSDGFLIVHQDKVGRGEGRIAQGFVQFLAAQRCGSNDSDAVVSWHVLVGMLFRRVDRDVLEWSHQALLPAPLC